MATQTTNITFEYVLGYTAAEHERLIRQAALIAPITERLFRDAGIGPGQRVLDLGSGVGDVSMIVARMVGPSGEVIGIERDAKSIAHAEVRIRAAGIRNARFREGDIADIATRDRFDAVVGRLILEFLPDAGAVICSLAKRLRPGGVLAIQDACWGPFLKLTAGLRLFSKCASLIHQSFQHSGANMHMERILYRSFREAGFPAANLRIEVPAGDSAVFSQWTYDLLCSLRPEMQRHGLVYKELGDFRTLRQRLESELAKANMFGTCIGLVGAWSRKPQSAGENDGNSRKLCE